MLSACEKFQGKGYRLPKRQTCFSIYWCVASPAKGCWKGWLLLSSASLPGRLMTLISLSFPLEKTCGGTDVLGPQKQKEPGGRGEGEGLTRPPKKPSSCAPLPRPHSTHQARPLPLPPSPAGHRLHRLSISRLPPVSGRSPRLGECIQSSPFVLFLIGQSPCHPLSPHPEGRGTGRGQGGPVNADGLLPGGCLAPSRVGEWGGLQGQISLNNFHKVGSQTQK